MLQILIPGGWLPGPGRSPGNCLCNSLVNGDLVSNRFWGGKEAVAGHTLRTRRGVYRSRCGPRRAGHLDKAMDKPACGS